MSGFKDPDYCPGGRTAEAERRARARRAGYASGRARRARSPKLRRRVPCDYSQAAQYRQKALALRYRIRQVGAEEFERLYRAMCARQGFAFDRRGLNTAQELYRAQMTAYRAQGQDYETTNAQAARSLELRGRCRCRRTVQRTRQRLEAMGLIFYSHVKRSGHLRIRGQMDSLRVRCCSPSRANVTPPTGAGACPTGQAAPACTSTALIAPADAGRDRPPDKPAVRPGTEEERVEAAIRFQQMKLDIGWGAERAQQRICELQRELRELMSPPHPNYGRAER